MPQTAVHNGGCALVPQVSTASGGPEFVGKITQFFFVTHGITNTGNKTRQNHNTAESYLIPKAFTTSAHWKRNILFQKTIPREKPVLSCKLVRPTEDTKAMFDVKTPGFLMNPLLTQDMDTKVSSDYATPDKNSISTHFCKNANLVPVTKTRRLFCSYFRCNSHNWNFDLFNGCCVTAFVRSERSVKRNHA